MFGLLVTQQAHDRSRMRSRLWIITVGGPFFNCCSQILIWPTSPSVLLNSTLIPPSCSLLPRPCLGWALETGSQAEPPVRHPPCPAVSSSMTSPACFSWAVPTTAGEKLFTEQGCALSQILHPRNDSLGSERWQFLNHLSLAQCGAIRFRRSW